MYNGALDGAEKRKKYLRMSRTQVLPEIFQRGTVPANGTVLKSRATENTRRQRVKETRTRRSIPVYIQRDEEDNGKGDEESRRGGVSVCKVHREKTSGVG